MRLFSRSRGPRAFTPTVSLTGCVFWRSISRSHALSSALSTSRTKPVLRLGRHSTSQACTCRDFSRFFFFLETDRLVSSFVCTQHFVFTSSTALRIRRLGSLLYSTARQPFVFDGSAAFVFTSSTALISRQYFGLGPRQYFGLVVTRQASPALVKISRV